MISALKASADLIKLTLFGLLALGVLVFYEGIPFIYEGRVGQAFQKGADHEAFLWTQRMTEIRLKSEKLRQEDQHKIDQIEAEYLMQRYRAEEALDELSKARRASPSRDNIAIPKALAEKLNKVGRPGVKP